MNLSASFVLKTLLKHLAESLTIAILDRGIVTYLERGTFIIILPSLARRKDIAPILKKIQQILSSTLDPQQDRVLSDKSYSPIASKIDLGIAFYPDCGTNLPVVIQQAKKNLSSTQYCRNHQNYASYQSTRESSIDRLAIKKRTKECSGFKRISGLLSTTNRTKNQPDLQ